MTALPRVLWPLLFGNFVIGTGVMAVPGTLNEIGESLAITPAAAGQLISAGAILMCIGAPLCAAFVAGWDRRRLLAYSMVWFAVFHLACAAAPDFGTLLPLRVLALLPPAVFTPQAAACIGLLVPPQQRGRAVTFVFLGWSVASVLGMPLAALVGGTFGWRTVFACVAVLAAIAAAWVWRAMPDGVKPPALSLASWKQTFRSRPLMLCVLVTVLCGAGQFTVFAYFAPYMRQRLGASAAELSAIFLWYGVFGFLGNVLVSRYIERWGVHRAVMVTTGLMGVSMLLLPLGTSIVLMAVVIVPWALGCFSMNSAQQARLIGIAPSLAAGSVALNTSAIYAGQAIGAGGGGWLITHMGMGALGWAAAAWIALAMIASAMATRAAFASAPSPAGA
ncbi:MFS transporter [Ramlibacter sp.]|uniref:MFS transporter n=1 Tax=Ramlibacter sp. TaxID=1917967 RepID=UPI003D117BC6